jgi:long-chain acyl-CoA synthetase
MSVYSQQPWKKLYPSYVPDTMPVPEKTQVDILEENAEKKPNAPAIYYFDDVITYRQLNEWADCFASQLAKWGVSKGDRVAVYTQNNPQFLISQYAAWKRGAVIVPLNPMFKEKELEYHLNDSGAKVLVCLDALYESYARSVIPKTSVEQVVTTNELDFISEKYQGSIPVLENSKKLHSEGTFDLKEILIKGDVDPSDRNSVSPEDIAFLVYTSGTTGDPKGAINLHKNIAFNAEVYRTWMKIDDSDIVLGVAPLFHITGIVGHSALANLAGIPLILFHRFDPREAFRLIEKWRPTMTVGSITVYIALMNDTASRNADLGSLKKCYSGGAPIAPKLTEQFEKTFGVYIHNIYGLTESNSPTHAVPFGKKAPVDKESGALSVGVPVPNCDAKVVDLEDPGKEVGIGEAGEFAVRGPMIFAGYWEKPEATKKAFYGSYFLTGDVVIMDKEGWFYVVDRKKDMIVASGFKVWPREVEDMLYQHPGVKEAAVVGMPDEYRGETVKAFVSLKDDFVDKVTPEEIIQFCKERMAAYKYPRQVVILPEVPKTATGKFLRRQLRS